MHFATALDQTLENSIFTRYRQTTSRLYSDFCFTSPLLIPKPVDYGLVESANSMCLVTLLVTPGHSYLLTLWAAHAKENSHPTEDSKVALRCRSRVDHDIDRTF
jgi:hypothetical protein